MKPLTTTRADRSARPLPGLVPPGPEISSTYLAPADPFPFALAERDLHVLHSRITRHIESEHIDPAGPHPTGARPRTEENR